MKNNLTSEYVEKCLKYFHTRGHFVWRDRPIEHFNKCKNPEQTHSMWNTSNSGMIAGMVDSNGYRIITIDREAYKAHRLVWLLEEGYWPENQIDHINRYRDDNRRCNLREVSAQCNTRNKKKLSSNTSGITGVSYRPNQGWVAYVTVQHRYIHLGTFDNIIDAAKARWEGEKSYEYPTCNTISSAYNYLKENNLLDNN